jgi:hypothetical protein
MSSTMPQAVSVVSFTKRTGLFQFNNSLADHLELLLKHRSKELLLGLVFIDFTVSEVTEC